MNLSSVALVFVMFPNAETLPADCHFVFEPDPTTGRFAAVSAREDCFERLVRNDVERLGRNHEVGTVATGLLTYTSSNKASYRAETSEWRYRWRIEFAHSFEVPPSVATRFRRIEASEPIGPARITKCNLTPRGFDLFVSWEEALEIYELEVEWAAYEVDPPVTPGLCRENAF